MFTQFLYAMRGQGMVVGAGEWILFLDALKQGLATDSTELYHLGRALLCRSETEFDRYDLAFAEAFDGAGLPPDLQDKLKAWLENALAGAEGAWREHGLTAEELWSEFLSRLKEQTERHDGGSRWIGTGGDSPFGHSGRGANGIRVGGPGGGRQAVNVAMERRWEGYRTDRTLDIRDFQVALRALRNLAREGDVELDLDETIQATCRNAGDIQLVDRRARQNQVHVVLLMDAGGSMAPHAERVNRLFSAAQKMHTFKTFEAWSFHNCIYGWLYRDYHTMARERTEKVLDRLTPRHRLLFVGDASMAPYELFQAFGWPGEGALAGLDWLQRFRARCQASVWLNPDPRRYWDHPTVSAIGRVFPMFELTLDGLRDAVRRLRAPV